MDTSELLPVFDRRVAEYRLQWLRCRQSPDEEAVHDLRVAIRRLLALVDLLRSRAFGLRAGKLRRSLKRQLAGLSELRDNQVMQARVQSLLPQWPAGMPLLLALREQEHRLLRQARETLAGDDARRLRKQLGKLRRRLAGWAGNCRDALGMAMTEAHHALLQRRCMLPAGPVDEALLDGLHRERIAWKRLRYAAEILRELDPTSMPQATLDHLRAQQSLLGAIQDARVFIAALQAARV